jgi:hypothetical protein
MLNAFFKEFTSILFYIVIIVLIVFFSSLGQFKSLVDSDFAKLLGLISSVVTILGGLALVIAFGKEVFVFTILNPFWLGIDLNTFLKFDGNCELSNVENRDSQLFLFNFHKELIRESLTNKGYDTILTDSQTSNIALFQTSVCKRLLINSVSSLELEYYRLNQVTYVINRFTKLKADYLECKDLKFLQLAVITVLGYEINSLEFDFMHEYLVFSLDDKPLKFGNGLSSNQINTIAKKWAMLLSESKAEKIAQALFSSTLTTPHILYQFVRNTLRGN